VSDATSARELAARIIAALPHASLFDRLNVGSCPTCPKAPVTCARAADGVSPVMEGSGSRWATAGSAVRVFGPPIALQMHHERHPEVAAAVKQVSDGLDVLVVSSGPYWPTEGPR
jgi:hypothetical protein